MNSDNKDAIRIILVCVFLYGLANALGKLFDDLPDWIGTVLEVPLILGGLVLSSLYRNLGITPKATQRR